MMSAILQSRTGEDPRIRAENVPPVYIFCIGQTENSFDFLGRTVYTGVISQPIRCNLYIFGKASVDIESLVLFPSQHQRPIRLILNGDETTTRFEISMSKLLTCLVSQFLKEILVSFYLIYKMCGHDIRQ